ncbi:MAG: amylo-alpha-1,6-glucosidase [Phycisphaerales bacterium]
MADEAQAGAGFPFVRTWDAGVDARRLPEPGWHDEWLLTSGHGGFAMGTPEGIPRRKYHALLIGTLNPPVDRIAVLQWVDVGIRGSGEGEGASARWCGASTLRRFERRADSVVWQHEVESVRVEVMLRLARHRSACRIDVTASDACVVSLRPWLTVRDFHATLDEGGDGDGGARGSAGESERMGDAGLSVRVDAAGGVVVRRGDALSAWLASPGSRFVDEPAVSEMRIYDLETARGLPDRERWRSPGVFRVDIAPGSGATLHAGLGDRVEVPDERVYAEEPARLRGLVERAERASPALRGRSALVLAGDQFIVRRVVDGGALSSIIAGYPWFADWGRDTMIALPGLLLATGRLDEAFGCLEAFARHESEGMIPNRFDDYGGAPHYNTVDASLWFVHACRAWWLASGETARMRGALLPACRAIVARYETGTRFGIRADASDGLIIAGDETTQLTWMDAKRDGVVFTPRHGKAVEINALWHHALRCLAEMTDDGLERSALLERASFVRGSFERAFWDAERECLRDCLRGGADGAWVDTGELRPNQVFAASLEFGPVTDAQRRAIVRSVREALLTPMGLRTLAPGSPGYRPRFEGDMMERDGAYHNGTVWAWLIGAYAEGVLRAGGFDDASRREARAAIEPLLASLGSGCLGSIAEIFDAEPSEPAGDGAAGARIGGLGGVGGVGGVGGGRRQEGCLAQAWSVGEPLRILALLGGA